MAHRGLAVLLGCTAAFVTAAVLTSTGHPAVPATPLTHALEDFTTFLLGFIVYYGIEHGAPDRGRRMP